MTIKLPKLFGIFKVVWKLNLALTNWKINHKMMDELNCSVAIVNISDVLLQNSKYGILISDFIYIYMYICIDVFSVLHLRILPKYIIILSVLWLKRTNFKSVGQKRKLGFISFMAIDVYRASK